MPTGVHSLVPVVYVTDVAASVAFYGLLGFEPQVNGDDGQWSWAYLRCAELGILLGCGPATPPAEPGPVHIYLRTDDLATLQERVTAAGVPSEHLGYPDHAPGGELRVADPDNHVIIIGQTTGAPPVSKNATQEPDRRASILNRAADAVRRRGGTDQRCQVGQPDSSQCPAPAEVKLTDSWGDNAWSCLRHAEEAVLAARGVFLATEDSQGLGQFLAVRRRSRISG